MIRQAVILAGGAGTRLPPTSLEDSPKVIRRIGGIPFLVVLVRKLKSQGFETIHLCLGLRANDVLVALDKHGMRIDRDFSASFDTRKAGGTAAAMRDAFPFLEAEFLLSVGDTFPAYDFPSYSRPVRAPTMIVGVDCEGVESNVSLSGQQIVRYEKHGFSGANATDFGAYVLRRGDLEMSQFQSASLEECWAALASDGVLEGTKVTGAAYDIGTPSRIEGFRATHGDLLAGLL